MRILIVPLFFLPPGLYAQTAYDDSVRGTAAEAYVKNYYNQQRGNEAAIFNGLFHFAYPSIIEGTAYFLSDNWQTGTVVYDHILYSDMMMKYDLVADQLVIASKNEGSVPVSLFSPRVKEFSFAGFHFIYNGRENDVANLADGIYQVLVQGRATALCKTSRTITETISSNTLLRKFDEKKRYYISRDNRAYPVNRKNDLPAILKDRKKEVQGFMKSIDLKFRKDAVKIISDVTEFYNKIPGK